MKPLQHRSATGRPHHRAGAARRAWRARAARGLGLLGELALGALAVAAWIAVVVAVDGEAIRLP